MKTRKKILGLIVTLVIVAFVVYVAQDVDRKREGTPDWTYTKAQRDFLNTWKDGKGSDLPANALPESILSKFGITSDTISPEVFFSNEVQEMLRSLPTSELINHNVKIEAGPTSLLNGSVSGLKEYLNRFSGDDMKKRVAAIAGISDPNDLPPQVLKEIDAASERMKQVQLELFKHDRHLYNRESYSSTDFDSAFSSLHTKDRERLEPLLGQLSNVPTIYDALPDMTSEQRRSAFRLLTRLKPERDQSTFVLPPEVMEKMQKDREQGFSVKQGRPSATSLLREKIDLSLDDTASSYSKDLFGRGIYHLNQGEGRNLLHELTYVPSKYISTESENYLIHDPNSSKWTRFYTSTHFGGALIVEEAEVDDAGVYFPNLQIAERDAVIMHHLHSDNQWITLLAAFNGFKQFHFTVEGKLNGQRRAEFIDFCTEIVEGSYEEQ